MRGSPRPALIDRMLTSERRWVGNMAVAAIGCVAMAQAAVELAGDAVSIFGTNENEGR